MQVLHDHVHWGSKNLVGYAPFWLERARENRAGDRAITREGIAARIAAILALQPLSKWMNRGSLELFSRILQNSIQIESFK